MVQKPDTQFYFWDNFGNSAPILTIFSLLQAEIYGAQQHIGTQSV